ncbi:sulfur carrier protein ThiS [Marinilabilia sp.]|jgi:sulfur carrier protein
MIVYLNNKQVVLSDEASLYVLLEEKGLDRKKGIAVAVNNKVIKAAEWPSRQLSENDKVLVISATKGG